MVTKCTLTLIIEIIYTSKMRWTPTNITLYHRRIIIIAVSFTLLCLEDPELVIVSKPLLSNARAELSKQPITLSIELGNYMTTNLLTLHIQIKQC